MREVIYAIKATFLGFLIFGIVGGVIFHAYKLLEVFFGPYAFAAIFFGVAFIAASYLAGDALIKDFKELRARRR